MPGTNIVGVEVNPVRQTFSDERGMLRVLWCAKWNTPNVQQVYQTSCFPGVVKAWHMHREQFDLFAPLLGVARVGLVDWREGSTTYLRSMTVILRPDAPVTVRIPPGVLHGFTSANGSEVTILNMISNPYNPDDEVRIPWNDPEVPYEWTVKNG